MITKNTEKRRDRMYEMLELLFATVRERSDVDVLEDEARGVRAHDRRETDDRREVREPEAKHQRSRQQHASPTETRCHVEQTW
jgi:hypothetical protein